MSISYIAYVDESGDPGLKLRSEGASEWLVLSALVVRQRNDSEVQSWADELRGKFKNSQTRHIHFVDLNSAKKEAACRHMAAMPCRYFFVASHKENMVDYRNARINDGNRAWYYWWLTRLLLERVTKFCESRSPETTRRRDRLRIVFSKRGGLRYIDLRRYLEKIKSQSSAGRLVLKQGDVAWSLIDFEEIRVLRHEEHAGLQLADIGAGALFQAIERNKIGACSPQYLKALAPRIARDKAGGVLGFGLKVMPQLGSINLAPCQREVFEHFGFKKDGWLSTNEG